MSNALNLDLTDKVVVIAKNFVRPAYHALEARLFHVHGGFGAHSFTIGTALIGVWLKEHHHSREEGFMVERLATEEEIEAVRKAYPPRAEKSKTKLGQRKVHFKETTDG